MSHTHMTYMMVILTPEYKSELCDERIYCGQSFIPIYLAQDINVKRRNWTLLLTLLLSLLLLLLVRLLLLLSQQVLLQLLRQSLF